MRPLLLWSFIAVPALFGGADWPQWRGPLRNGTQPDSPPLLDAIPAAGLKELWASEPIPANDEGGLSSPIAAGGKVFVALAWHRDVPTETRQIGERVLGQLGHQNVSGLPKEVVAQIEQTRQSIPAGLRGKKLDEFIGQWIDERLDAKQKQLYSGFISNRFKKGPLALPLEVLEKLDQGKQTVFPNETAMKEWLDAQGWPDGVKQQIIAAVPPTKRVADDALVCLDLVSGKTLWKAISPGAPVGWNASATPCHADGKVFAVGSSRIWCVDAENGQVVWETALKKKRTTAASPMAIGGLVIVNADGVTAFDAATGEERWRQEKAGGGNSSPVVWGGAGQPLLLINGRSDLHALDLQSGAIVWKTAGGGDATPAIAGDLLVVQTQKPELGLIACQLSPTGAKLLWNVPLDALRTQASPIIDRGAVYLMDDNVHACFDASTGKEQWRATAQSTISSPVLADGKLLVMANNGNTLMMLKATPEARVELGKATVRAQWVPSPCLADGRLVLRLGDKLKCWSLLP